MKIIERDYLQKLINVIGTPDIKVITGVRRSGKSKLLEIFEDYIRENIEEHNIIGGLGSAVSEYLVTKINRPKQISVGIADCNYKLGSRQFMLEDAGLTCNAIAKKIISELNDAL